jgi:hypothetical protein
VFNQLSTMPWRRMGSGVLAPPFLTTALDGGELSASRPGRFTPKKESSEPIEYGAVWSLVPVWTLWGRENFLSLPAIKPRPSSPQPVAIPTELPRLLRIPYVYTYIYIYIYMVKLSLCLTNEVLRHQGVWGSVRIDPYFLDLGTSWRWVVSFTFRSFYPGETAPGTHWLGGWMDPRKGLDDMEKRKFLTLTGLELRLLGRPTCSQSLYRLLYPGYLYVCIYIYIYICIYKSNIITLPYYKQTSPLTKSLV